MLARTCVIEFWKELEQRTDNTEAALYLLYYPPWRGLVPQPTTYCGLGNLTRRGVHHACILVFKRNMQYCLMQNYKITVYGIDI